MRKRPILLSLAGATTAAVILTATLVVAPAIRADRTMPAAAVPTPLMTSSTPLPTSTPTPTPTPSPTPTPTAQPLSESAQEMLVKQVTGAVVGASRGAQVGFEVYDRDLGTSGEVLAGSNADTPLYTASVVKLLIAIDALHSNNWQPLSATDSDELAEMLEGSNDGDASAFWERDGGNAIITRMVGLIGLKHTLLPSIVGQWGMAKMSASDVVAVYQFIDNTMPASAKSTIMDALYHAKETADDGFPQYFGIPAGLPNSTWSIKQGWMILKSAVVLNTTGVVGADNRYVVVLMTSQSAYTSYAKGRAAVSAGIAALKPSLTLVSKTG
jgi:hypothetical protein